MEQKQAHIIIVDGPSKSGKKLFGLELAITLMYNKQKTALLLNSDSPLNKIINSRITSHHFLPTPTIINKDSFVKECHYCTETGLLAGPHCPASKDTGYYKTSDNNICTLHTATNIPS
jgi:hypothetical protein